MAVWLVHALDDAFVHREPGVGPGQHLLAVAVALILALGAVYAFPFVRPAARSALACFFAALATVDGALHAKHVAAASAGASDVTGVLALAAGVVLIGLAAAVLWLHRGEGAAGRRRRWAYRIARCPSASCSRSTPSCRSARRSPRRTRSASPSAPRRAPTTARSRSTPVTASTSRAGIARRATARRCSSSTAAGAIEPAPSRTPSYSPPRLRRPALRRPRSRRERGQAERVRLGLDQGHHRRDRLPEDRPEVDAQRIGGLGLSTGADALVQAAGQGRTSTRSSPTARPPRVRGLAAPAGHHRDDAHVRRRVRGRPDHLGRAGGAPVEDMIKRVTRPLLLVSAGRPRSATSTSSTTATPAAAPSSIGTCRGRPHRRDPRRGARVRAPRDGLPRQGPLTRLG